MSRQTMTEERIKERLAEIGWVMSFTGEYHAKTEDVIAFIRTVAAEGRKEGINEVLQAVNGLKAVTKDSMDLILERAKSRTEGIEHLLVAMKEISNKPLTKAQMRAIARYHLLQESEWLKEQGCTR